MSATLIAIQKKLTINSNKAALAAQQNFVPGVATKIYGVRMPVLNHLAREYKSGGYGMPEPMRKKCWQ